MGPARFLIRAARRNLFWERGNVVAAGAADPTSSLPFPAGAGKASPRGRVGRGRRGCARIYPRSLSLALLDSSPYEGEPNLKGCGRGAADFIACGRDGV